MAVAFKFTVSSLSLFNRSGYFFHISFCVSTLLLAKPDRKFRSQILITDNKMSHLSEPLHPQSITPSPDDRVQTVQTVPIGRPIANTQIYILNPYLQPVPIGVIGEIYVGGQGVGRGYLHRPELTETQFIPNPFTDQIASQFPRSDPKPNSKLYKTGDLGRYLSDGTIEYIGRLDHQVKIRGFRLELGEIEAILLQHPAVKAAIVVVREAAELQQLIAYAEVQGNCSESALRQFLKTKLPDYMVPAWIIILEALPLSPNGKVDRKALPSPEGSSPDVEFIAPRTPLEAELVKIWSAVLQVDSLSIKDNFFDRGGHSLLAVRLIAKIQEQLIPAQIQTQLPLGILFQAPTIEEMATLLESKYSEILLPLVGQDA
jgi:hypothetical protein